MSKLTERLRRILHADDRLDREMAAEWEDAPAGQPAPLPPQEEKADEPEVTVSFFKAPNVLEHCYNALFKASVKEDTSCL